MDNTPNEWEQSIIDNAVEYSILEWRSLNKTTKTIDKTYKEAKNLFQPLQQGFLIILRE